MSEILASGRGIGGRDREGLPVTDDAVTTWFVREILPLEAILMHYLRTNWRNPSDLPDLRQEIYTRVFESARERIPDHPKRFLLTAARNLLINLVRRKQVVAMEAFADFDVIATDAPEPDISVIEKEELCRVKAAIAQLPPRTRQAIELTFIEGLSCAEIGRRMGVSKQTAYEFVSKGTLVVGEILFTPQIGQGAKP
jgi:RNA polymerase sigma factor (sigma-70 family)